MPFVREEAAMLRRMRQIALSLLLVAVAAIVLAIAVAASVAQNALQDWLSESPLAPVFAALGGLLLLAIIARLITSIPASIRAKRGRKAAEQAASTVTWAQWRYTAEEWQRFRRYKASQWARWGRANVVTAIGMGLATVVVSIGALLTGSAVSSESSMFGAVLLIAAILLGLVAILGVVFSISLLVHALADGWMWIRWRIFARKPRETRVTPIGVHVGGRFYRTQPRFERRVALVSAPSGLQIMRLTLLNRPRLPDTFDASSILSALLPKILAGLTNGADPIERFGWLAQVVDVPVPAGQDAAAKELATCFAEEEA
jgi:hypothetical protein